MSYNNSFFPAFQFLAEPYVVFAHQPMNLPYPKGRLPQKFHWNNFRGGYGHPYYSMIGHDYLIGPTAGQHDLPTLPSMTIWPFTLHLYGGSFITQLDQQLQCPWMSIQEATLPIPCNAAPFLQWHSPFRIGILCPTSLNGYAGYAAMLWIYGCHHWDQAGRPFHNSLGATRFLHLSQWNWQYHTIPTNFRKRSRLVVALTEVDGTSRNELTFFAMIQQVLSQCGRSLGLCG